MCLPGPLYANSPPSTASISSLLCSFTCQHAALHSSHISWGFLSVSPSLAEHPATPSALGSAWQKEALGKHPLDGRVKTASKMHGAINLMFGFGRELCFVKNNFLILLVALNLQQDSHLLRQQIFTKMACFTKLPARCRVRGNDQSDSALKKQKTRLIRRHRPYTLGARVHRAPFPRTCPSPFSHGDGTCSQADALCRPARERRKEESDARSCSEAGSPERPMAPPA